MTEQRHMAYPVQESEGFPLQIETIDINDNYVLFKGGLQIEVTDYLSLDEYTDDGSDADTCIVNHPHYGWLIIDIEPVSVRVQ